MFHLDEERGMNVRSVATCQIKLYLSGPIDVAKQIIREFCMVGLCVTIEPTQFIYTGGEESGYVVGLLNYPRFPDTPENLEARARELSEKLLKGTFQTSALMVSNNLTTWITTREVDPSTLPSSASITGE